MVLVLATLIKRDGSAVSRQESIAGADMGNNIFDTDLCTNIRISVAPNARTVGRLAEGKPRSRIAANAN